MKLQKTLLALGLTCTFAGGLIAEEAATQKSKTFSKEELASDAFNNRLSEAYGHLVQKSLDNPVLKLNFDGVIKGMQDAKAGKPSPMTEEEYEEAINAIQEVAYQDMSAKNLQEAENFLKDNARKDGVKELQPGKLQFSVLKEGDGKTVTEGSIAEINYKGQYASGQVFGSSEEAGGPISINLSQTIPGFRQGLVGMKEGEKRKLFIHPELGYGTSGQLMPNALLIFDVEVVKVKEKPPQDKDKAGQEKLLSDATDSEDDLSLPEEVDVDVDDEPDSSQLMDDQSSDEE